MINSRFYLILWLLIVWGHFGGRLEGVTITGYSPEANDRFASGFPSAPVDNLNPDFVGLGYDWSSAGWASSPVSKGFGFLSPQHYLVARHFGGATTLRISDGQGSIESGSQRGVTATGFGAVFSGQTLGDLSIGALQTPFSASVAPYRSGVLDLNASSTSNTPSNYNGLSVFLYAAEKGTTLSPRVGEATISGVTVSGNNHLFTTDRTNVQLEDGDSGSPAFHGWTNPNGGKDLLTIGNNAAINATTNFLNFTGTFEVMNALNAVMTADGFALRVEGNPSRTWQGSITGQPGTGGQLTRSQNWSGNTTPNDVYVLFDAGGNSVRNLNVDGNLSLRGLYFREAGTDGFEFGGANTLTIGRGGLTNYGAARQIFSASLALGDHQYWDVGEGGVTVNSLNTNGRLLEVAGPGTARFNGVISGSGGLAVSGARVEMLGENTYTGITWVHSGALNVAGSLSAGSQVRLGADGRLEGTGTVGLISGGGSIDPGNSPGILTASAVDPSGGLTFNFEFTSTGSPDYGSPNASLNDVLRLTSGIPFSSGLTSANEVRIFLDVDSLSPLDTFRGGFFTDQQEDFLSFIENGSFVWYLADADGDISYNGFQYSLYTGPLQFELGTVAESADFGSGLIEGQVMEFVLIPEPGTLILLGLTGLAAVLGFWGRGRQAERL